MPRETQRREAQSGQYVTIDRNFVRNEAREAVRQFFRPITAPFEAARDKRLEPAKVKPADDRRRR